MRNVPAAMTTAWKAQTKMGAQRPVVRATVQKTNLQKFDYDTADAAGGDFEHQRHRRGQFTSMIFGDLSHAIEIRNIKTCSWSRSIDQDVATCTLVLQNADITPIGNADEIGNDGFDLQGWFTYNRGEQRKSANRWGYETDTGWQGRFVPDRVVKTFEGYGSDPTVPPALDANLLQTGVWLIDKVTYTHDGQITLDMRDLGRMLLDQICFPPVVPYAEYPLSWEKIHSENVPSRDCTGGSWTDSLKGEGTAASSNTYYIGEGISNAPYGAYVGPNGGVDGHHPNHVLENQDGEWWVSTGQTTPKSKVWWEIALNDETTAMAGIRIHPHGGPYRIYISLENGNGWIGKKKIPYAVTTEGVDVQADIPFVDSVMADRGMPFDVILRRKYANIKRVRLTFSSLQDMHVGDYPFRAALRDIRLYTAPNVSSLGFAAGEVMKVVGNYTDFTQIVKWVCAWGGFYWPPHSTGKDFIQLAGSLPEHKRTITYAEADVRLPKGRVWGDFMKSGTAGEANLTIDQFDKKPLMDVINYCRDLLGFIFFVDETGGIVWRMPNLGLAGSTKSAPKLGNYLSPTQLGQRTRSRTSNIVTIDEKDTLISYSTTLSSMNIRERVFVGNITGQIGTVVRGYNPYPAGLRRNSGWTDQNFKTVRETRVMADMIVARQMFDYRRGAVTIPGYPAIQIDDQIRIFERVTNETFYHYVLGVESSLDMESGHWTYNLSTHWLGERPSDAWVVDVDVMDTVTKAYLNELDGEGGD